MGNVEELGEDEGYAGGAGYQEDCVEGGEVGVGAAVRAIDRSYVRCLGCYGVLLGLR